MNSLALNSAVPFSRASKTALFAALCLITLLLASASAKASCGIPNGPIKPMARQIHNGAALLESAAFEGSSSTDPIVGMWHVVFNGATMNGQPFSGVVDDAVVVWHADGTEIMNSSRPAQDGNFSLGVWIQTGYLHYQLNHIAWHGNDLSNAPAGIGNPQNGTQIEVSITLSPSGNSYVGIFTLKAYDSSGNLSVAFTGSVTARRIVLKTPIQILF